MIIRREHCFIMTVLCVVKAVFIVLNSSSRPETSYVARQYGIDVQHEWDFRGGKDYLIAGVTGKQETYRATQAPVYTRPHRNTYAVYE